MTAVKVMLAGKCEDIATLRYPVMVSHKLDGVRAVVAGGVLMSRNWKPIPNAHVQKLFGKLPEGTDGELILGDPTAPDAYRKTVSAVMSEDGEPDVTFHVFDNYKLSGEFQRRIQIVTDTHANFPSVKVVPHHLVHSAAELELIETAAVEDGHEGIMVRRLDGHYKHGRSSSKEGILLKVKRFADANARVVSVYEWETNNNEATKNAFGRTERSSHQDKKVGAGVLGGLNVIGLEEPYEGVEFSIGTGFTGAADPDGERGKLWKQQKSLIGKIAKFQYFPSGGKDKPRFPVFLGWRDGRDM